MIRENGGLFGLLMMPLHGSRERDNIPWVVTDVALAMIGLVVVFWEVGGPAEGPAVEVACGFLCGGFRVEGCSAQFHGRWEWVRRET